MLPKAIVPDSKWHTAQRVGAALTIFIKVNLRL